VGRNRQALDGFLRQASVGGLMASPVPSEEPGTLLEEVRQWFVDEPWRGEPDPGSFGGHAYSDNEREIGYGSFRDPRFLPRALKGLHRRG
jgi:hypothetical protein